jgi:RIO-like serine/threonine protein kinase
MSSTKPETAALSLLRAIFELSDADMRVSLDLLARLGGYSTAHTKALVTQLRRAKLVQEETFALTMVGLAAAVALPEFEPCEAPSRARSGLCAA